MYIPERPPTLIDMEKALQIMKHRFSSTPAQIGEWSRFHVANLTNRIGLIVNSENASDVFTSAFIEKLHENADLKVSSRKAALTGLQQGGDESFLVCCHLML